MKSNALKTRKTLNKFVMASVALAKCTYSGKMLKRALARRETWCDLHDDALEVLKCQEELDATI